MSKREFIALGADSDEVELVTWYLSNGCQALVKYGVKKSDGWL